MASIYIHIPFCKQACHYCDFHFSTSLKKKDDMLFSIVKELELRQQELAGSEIESIYFGGGTPSIMDVGEIEGIIGTINKYFKVGADPEITLEANPDDLDREKIKALAGIGINRLSVGIQSFFDEDLRLMNRAHNSDEARRCVDDSLEYFSNISVDLIYGIPNLSNDRWEENIKTALHYNVPHISSYALTVEPRTALKAFIDKGIVPDVDEDMAEQQFRILVELLEARDYVHYEISNFGKPGFFSVNNTAYWLGKTYMGVGPSSHSYDGLKRTWNIRNNSKYIRAIKQGHLPMETELLSNRDKYNEYVMTGLRTLWGVSFEKLKSDFGESYHAYLMEQIQPFLKDHLLFIDNNVLRATKKGKFLIDGIASHLFMLNLEKP